MRGPAQSPFVILGPRTRETWRRLWADYVDFYEAHVTEDVTAGTWRRQLDPEANLFGRLAELDGTVVGFTVSVLHEGTWTLAPVCYLEDLFVDPEFRGRGLGRALIDDLVTMARARGWSRLYDSYTQADDFVRYRLFLT